MSGNRSGGVPGMETMIPIFDIARDLLERTRLGKSKLQFPQIVAVGSQSSGKSSVLENLVGKPFLPRGSGITTRCPIVLRLVNTPQGSQTWCEFEHRQNERFTDFGEVESEINSRTQEIAGSNSGISDVRIKVTVHSPNVLNLTVVDLPGLVKVPVGEQPEDIETQINNLVLQYIKDENSIILAIARGNDDIANAESIKLAKSVDALQERTIVVVTKLDLAEDSHKIENVLRGNVISMKLGIIGVINRSQADIDSDKPIEEVLEYERQFLKDHFPSIAPYHGIDYLAHKLNDILRKYITAVCPQLTVKLRDMALAANSELLSLGVGVDLENSDKREILVSIIDKFCKEYSGQIFGQSRNELNTSSLSVGARVNFILREKLAAEFNLLVPFSNLTDVEILIAVRNALPVGYRMINPEVALEYFICQEVKKVLPLSLEITKNTYQEMVSMIERCLQENKQFPNINKAILAAVTELLNQRMDDTNSFLHGYFEVCSHSAWTSNPAYSDIFKDSMSTVCTVDLGNLPIAHVSKTDEDTLCMLTNETKYAPTGPTEFTPAQVELCKTLRNLSTKMFEIVQWHIQDFIAKSILTSLIYRTIKNVSIILHTKLNVPDKVDKLVREPEEVRNKRLCLQKEVEDYNDALGLLEKLMGEGV